MLARADRPQGTSDRTLSTFQTNSGADMVIQNIKNRLAILYTLNSASSAVPALGKICTLSRRPDDIGSQLAPPLSGLVVLLSTMFNQVDALSELIRIAPLG
jgi:hypothetical protein